MKKSRFSDSQIKAILNQANLRLTGEQAAKQRKIRIRLACKTYGISENCYRYRARLSDDNRIIADLRRG
ncbi:MAG: hypothetical protein K2Q13_13005 [Nitrosomonas sp.]|nr:hypothetical protein [Nitrosomonas sp.]